MAALLASALAHAQPLGLVVEASPRLVTLHLVDDRGQPLAGARVTDVLAETHWADEHGAVQATVAGGDVSLAITHDNAVGSYDGPVVDPICVALTRLGNLVGTLLDAAGQPVRGAAMRCDAADPASEEGVFVGTTDEWGQWMVRSVPRGEGVTVSFLTGLTSYEFVVWPGHTLCRLPAATAAAPAPNGPEKPPPPAPAIPEAVFTVLLPDGRPAVGAEVALQTATDDMPGPPVSAAAPRRADARGQVRLSVAPGRLRLVATTEKFHGSLVAEQIATGLKATLQLRPTPRREMRLRFVTKGGEGLDAKAAVEWSQDGAVPSEAEVDAEGRATLGVWSDAGPITVTLSAPLVAYQINRILVPRFDREVTVPLSVAGCFSVVGRILDSHRQPLRDQAVRLRQVWRYNPLGVDPADEMVHTDNEGRFRFARVGSWNELHLSLVNQPEAFHPPPFLPPADGPRDFGTLVLPLHDATVTGQVIGLDGRPADGVEVMACGLGISARSDSRGAFGFHGLPHEPVRLLAMAGRDLRAEAIALPGQPTLLRLRRWRLTAELCRAQALACLRDTAAELTNGGDLDDWGGLDSEFGTTAMALAALDGEAALRLCDAGNEMQKDLTVPPVMERLAQVDPDLACRELRRLDGIRDPERRWLAKARVGALVAPTHRAQAEAMLQALAPLDSGHGALSSGMAVAFDLARARLAACLGRPEAATWAEAAGRALSEVPGGAPGEPEPVPTGSHGAWLAEWPALLDRFLAPLVDPASAERLAELRLEALARLARVRPGEAVARRRAWFPVGHDAVSAAEAGDDTTQVAAALPALRLAAHDPVTAVAWAEALPYLAQRQAVWLEAAHHAPDRRHAEVWLGAAMETNAPADELALAWQPWDPARAAELAARAARLAAMPHLEEARHRRGQVYFEPALSWVFSHPNDGRRWLEQHAGAGREPGWPLNPSWAVLDPERFHALCAEQDARPDQLVEVADALLAWSRRLDPDADPVIEPLLEADDSIVFSTALP